MKKMWFVIVLTGLLLTACTEEKYIYSDPTDIAMFFLSSETFVATDEVVDNVKEVYVVSPVRVNTDRTYLVQVVTKGSDEEAKEGEQFELATSAIVTIPAGEVMGSFKVRAFPQSLSETEDKIAYFSLSTVDIDHPVADFNNMMSLVLARTCGFTPQEIAGRFDIYTSLLKLGTYENKIPRVVVEADPEQDNGFIVRSPYAKGKDLKMEMWPTERGTWDVEMEDGYLAYIVPGEGEEGEPFDVYGYGRGIWYPCTQTMYITYYLHLEGDSKIIGTVTELFKRSR